MITIYALIDPNTQQVRYIGRTKRLTRRISEHLRGKSGSLGYCANWINKLKAVGQTPRCIVLEYADDDNWAVREQWWIEYGRRSGWPLTNLTNGGETFVFMPIVIDELSDKTKKQWADPARRQAIMQSLRAAHNTPAAREHHRQAALGKSPSMETRRKLSALNMGKKLSPETTAKMSVARRGAGNHATNLSDEDVLNIRQARAEGVSRRFLAEWYNLSKTSITRIEKRVTWSHLPEL